jgi:hypothetical protein
VRYAASPAFVRALAENFLTEPGSFQALRKLKESPGQVDLEEISARHGKAFAKSLQQHKVLGVGANGVVLQSSADPTAALKVQGPVASYGKGRTGGVEDEVNAQALAAELGMAPRVRALETYPSGGSAIEMDVVDLRPEIQFRDKDLAVAMAELELINNGVIHKDVHAGNVGYDPSSRKVDFIDFGAASLNPEAAPAYKESAIVKGMQAMGNTDEAELFRSIAFEYQKRIKMSPDPVEKLRAKEDLRDLIEQGEAIVMGSSDADLERPYTSLENDNYPNAWMSRRFTAPQVK